MIFTPLSDQPRRLPVAAGLIASGAALWLAMSPPSHPYSWTRVFAVSVASVLAAFSICAVGMSLFGLRDRWIVLRSSAAGACIAPLAILLRQHSLLAPLVAAFIVWTVTMFFPVGEKVAWKKFLVAFFAAILLQLGVAAALGEKPMWSTLVLGLAAAPLTWRVRQERKISGPLGPFVTIAVALLLAIFALTRYLPIGFSSGGATAEAKTAPVPGLPVGGQYRGVILIPEEEQHTILVPPLPMMGRDPFRVHKDPIGIPFYGVYWFFQSPDRAPAAGAYKTRGTPDHVSFRSASREPLNMEAHQNLGRLIDIAACSRIDIAVRNADPYPNSIVIELILENTTAGPFARQSLGLLPVVSVPGKDPMAETLSFKIPAKSRIEQFDELTLRFHRAGFRATKSARVAIERFFLVPRNR